FFQAEDGIRDRNVTGVQTCALPIYGLLRALQFETAKPIKFGASIGQALQTIRLLDPEDEGVLDTVLRRNLAEQAPVLDAPFGLRSEERRVGKECRCRWAGE